MKDIINVEYEIIDYVSLPEHLCENYKYSVTISLYQVDENEKILSCIGCFNFKTKTKNKNEIKEFVQSNIRKIVIFKSKHQDKINRHFDRIVKSF